MKSISIAFVSLLLMACTGAKNDTTNSADSGNSSLTPSNEMISFKGGEFVMGNDAGLPNEKPAHKVKVADFKMDIYPVTVGEFAKFVQATSYITDAERFGDAGVYNFETNQWELKKGATWQYPLGPDQAKAELQHPVTQVSWNDAQAYCQWAKKRLPTEAEWEYAARNAGKSTSLYSWGAELQHAGKYMANVWLGASVMDDQSGDGFKYTSPVGYYGTMAAGLADMGGNVWNWCQDNFSFYPGNTDAFTAEPNSKTMRGGSFFFDPALQNSYTVYFRAPNTPETSLFNIGFRCVVDGVNK